MVALSCSAGRHAYALCLTDQAVRASAGLKVHGKPGARPQIGWLGQCASRCAHLPCAGLVKRKTFLDALEERLEPPLKQASIAMGVAALSLTRKCDVSLSQGWWCAVHAVAWPVGILSAKQAGKLATPSTLLSFLGTACHDTNTDPSAPSFPNKQAGELSALGDFTRQFDEARFRKGLEIVFAASGGKLVTRVDGQEVRPWLQEGKVWAVQAWWMQLELGFPCVLAKASEAFQGGHAACMHAWAMSRHKPAAPPSRSCSPLDQNHLHTKPLSHPLCPAVYPLARWAPSATRAWPAPCSTSMWGATPSASLERKPLARRWRPWCWREAGGRLYQLVKSNEAEETELRLLARTGGLLRQAGWLACLEC